MAKKPFWTKTTRIGAYTLAAVLIVLAILAVVNVTVAKLPVTYTKHDMTSLELYTLSDRAKEATQNLTEDVTIYLLCEDGEDNSGSALNNLPNLSLYLAEYAALTPHLHTEIVDMIAKPNFQNTYTDEALENYTLIVTSEKRFKIIGFYDLYYYDSAAYGQMTPEEYQQYAAYMSYYGGLDATLTFNGENVIVSALDFVTTDDIPIAYTLTGHGETALSDTLCARIETENMQVKELSLLTSAVPEDAGCVLIHMPQTDLNEDEAAALSAYLASGGRLFAVTVYAAQDLPNLHSVLAAYGMTAGDGMIVEGDSNRYYSGYPYYLIPMPSTTSPITAPYASSYYLFSPFAQPLAAAEDLPDTLTVTPLFVTSSAAYTCAPDAESLTKTEDAAEGPFAVALSAEDTASGARVVWVGAPVFTDNYDSVTHANYLYFTAMLNWLVPRDRIVQNLPATSLANNYLLVTESAAAVIGAVLVILLPLAFLGFGLVRWYVRRKR